MLGAVTNALQLKHISLYHFIPYAPSKEKSLALFPHSQRMTAISRFSVAIVVPLKCIFQPFCAAGFPLRAIVKKCVTVGYAMNANMLRVSFAFLILASPVSAKSNVFTCHLLPSCSMPYGRFSCVRTLSFCIRTCYRKQRCVLHLIHATFGCKTLLHTAHLLCKTNPLQCHRKTDTVSISPSLFPLPFSFEPLLIRFGIWDELSVHPVYVCFCHHASS